MDKFEEDLSQKEGHLSHQEIFRRFKNLFGREMTTEERRAFFLDTLRPEEEKG